MSRKKQAKPKLEKQAEPVIKKNKPVVVRKSGGRGALKLFVDLILWVTSVLVGLAVGFGMIDGTLTVPVLSGLTVAAGWVVVIMIILGAVFALIDALR